MAILDGEILLDFDGNLADRETTGLYFYRGARSVAEAQGIHAAWRTWREADGELAATLGRRSKHPHAEALKQKAARLRSAYEQLAASVRNRDEQAVADGDQGSNSRKESQMVNGGNGYYEIQVHSSAAGVGNLLREAMGRVVDQLPTDEPWEVVLFDPDGDAIDSWGLLQDELDPDGDQTLGEYIAAHPVLGSTPDELEES
jgi:hypothetical protein